MCIQDTRVVAKRVPCPAGREGHRGAAQDIMTGIFFLPVRGRRGRQPPEAYKPRGAFSLYVRVGRIGGRPGPLAQSLDGNRLLAILCCKAGNAVAIFQRAATWLTIHRDPRAPPRAAARIAGPMG